jgi:hypothetical protein
MALRRKPPRSGSSRSGVGEAERPERSSSFKPKPQKTEGPRPKGGRAVDERKTRAALRKLRRAVEQAEERAKDGAGDAKLSDWEREFAKSVETKLETYGSAFRDPSKGRLEEPLSARQSQKLREIGKKAAGKGGAAKRGSSFKPKEPPKRGGRVRDVSVIEDNEAPAPPPKKPRR